jgi:glycosidase
MNNFTAYILVSDKNKADGEAQRTAMPNLMLGNHDLVRFGDLIERGKKGDDWKRHKAAISFLGAWSGPVTLYYGDEIGDQVEGFAGKITENWRYTKYCGASLNGPFFIG